MNESQAAAWSEPLRLDQIGKGVVRRISASEESRRRIAAELDLASLDRLDAEVEVRPFGDSWEVSGRLSAAAEQTCGVTLEPLPVEIDARFAVRVVAEAPPVEDGPPVEFGLDSEDPPDVAEDRVIDLAAYVVEHLALELDPFPRKPGVEFEPPAGEAEPSPFAVLAKLRRDKADD